MAHLFPIEDQYGDLVDEVVFCSDWCHQSWCRENGKTYGGWYGCQEISTTVPCASCGEKVQGVTK